MGLAKQPRYFIYGLTKGRQKTQFADNIRTARKLARGDYNYAWYGPWTPSPLDGDTQYVWVNFKDVGQPIRAYSTIERNN